MTLPLISIFGVVAALAIGWKVGKMAQTAATEQLHLPVNLFGKLLPLAAAIALAGGLSVGAWQASEHYFTPADESAAEHCDMATTSSSCGGCPASQ